MRELAIGDIHGCARAFAKLLELVNPQPADTVVLLGDYVDRGPASCQVLDMILDLNKRCTAVALLGNHERMMLWAKSDPKIFKEWLTHGGMMTLESYALNGGAREIEAVPERHWTLLREQTLLSWETEKHIFVHASVDPQAPLSEQTEMRMLWEPFTRPMVHVSGKQIICGHKSQKTGLPAIFEGGVCIDTWAHGRGWLTCYDPAAQTFTQANENGEHRVLDFATLKGEGGG